MKTRNWVGMIVLLIILLACRLPGGRNSAVPVIETIPALPTGEQAAPVETVETAEAVDPVVIDEPPDADSGLDGILRGQISFVNGGSLWRYLLETDESVLVAEGHAWDAASFSWVDRAQFSPDGRYLAYTVNNRSLIQDLLNGEIFDLTARGDFFSWVSSGTGFFAVQGEFLAACDQVEDFSDQAWISFEIHRFELTDLENPTLIVRLPGGLQFLSDISPGGDYASVIMCGCQAGCGPPQLWHLTALAPVTSPLEPASHEFAFAPDGERMAVNEFHMGYEDSPLYVSATDFSQLEQIFLQAEVAIPKMRWSPGGDWIAFNALHFSSESWEETDQCVMVIRPDGSQLVEAACGYAELAAWSPDGGQLLYRLGDSLWVYNLAEGGHTRLPIESDAKIEFVDWGRLP